MGLLSVIEFGRGLAHLFYPQLCEGCRKPLLAGEEILCIACELELPLTGYTHIADNETAVRFAGRVPFLHATSLAYFTNDGLLQHLMHGLKYGSKKEIGRYLGRRMGQELRAAGWAPHPDVVMPVPLHRKKQASRGYNQAMLIAEGISQVLHVPATDKILTRIKNTESQTKKTRTERIKNMDQAFKVTQPDSIAGKHVLLCDDVLTTGATLEACANALLHSGGDVQISFATIGIAVS